ncbi:MAG TPA: biopolymer transporter ExbD [Acidobacteria bacterium]|nr:biopolymer transporter ExbD [Acidobacteriota bacterium]
MRLAKLGMRRKPEVQMSPLIDVVFLLLIFYSVTTQFVTDQRLKLKLPQAKTAEAAGRGQTEKPPVVTVAADGSVWINDRQISEAHLPEEIKRAVERGKEKGIILKGDKDADYGVVVHVLDLARAAGAKSIQMSAVKPSSESSK